LPATSLDSKLTTVPFCYMHRQNAAGATLLAVTLLLPVLVAGCDRAAIMRRMTPKDDEAFAKNAVDLLRHQKFGELKQEFSSDLTDYPYLDKTLATAAEIFPDAEPKSIKPVALQFSHDSGSSVHKLTLEYEFPSKWLLAAVVIKRTEGRTQVSGLWVTPIDQPLEYTNRFTLAGKGGFEYMVLGLTIVVPLFTFCVMAVCLRTKGLRWKWLWAIWILIGVGKLALNWTTGDVSFTPLSLQIPCGRAIAEPVYGPFVLSVSLPLGAILFLVKRRQIVSASEEQSPSTESPTVTE
jgi:hypothetical protein